MYSNQKSNYPEMLGQIGLAFGCVNYLSTPTETAIIRTSPAVSRQKVHPEDSSSSREKLSIKKASPDEKSSSETIQPKISPLLASDCTPTTESRTMTLYGYNAAAKLPFAFSHGRERVCRGGERRSLRAFKTAPTGRMVRSVSSGVASPHAPSPQLVEACPRPRTPGPQLHLM